MNNNKCNNKILKEILQKIYLKNNNTKFIIQLILNQWYKILYLIKKN